MPSLACVSSIKGVVRLVFFGMLLGFVQCLVTSDSIPSWKAVTSIARSARADWGSALPSIRAAARITDGLSPYDQGSAPEVSFNSPPIAALLYRPLTRLAPADALLRLSIANLALCLAIMASLLWLARPSLTNPRLSWREKVGIAAIVVCWYPLLRAVGLNYVNVLVTLLMGGVWLAMKAGRQVFAGVVLSAAIAINPSLIVAVPLLAWHARRALFAVLGTSLFLLIASVAYAGWHAHVQYVTQVLFAHASGYAFFSNQSWNGVLNRLVFSDRIGALVLAPPDSLVFAATTALSVLTYVLFAVRIRALPRTKAFGPDVFGLAWLAATLCSPRSRIDDYAPALFCIVWLWRRARSGDSPRTLSLAGAFGTSTVLLGTCFEVQSLDNPFSGLLCSYVFAGAWILGMAWLASLRRTGRADDELVWHSRLHRLSLPLPIHVVRRLEMALLAACCLFALYLLGHVLLFQYGRDQGIYAVVARTILEGRVPYRDAWDFKPPGIFFLYAIARYVFGPAMCGIRILEVLGILSLIPAFAIFSRRFVGSAKPALFAIALATMAWAQLEFWNTAQPENFAAVGLAWALVAATARVSIQGGTIRFCQALVWLLVGVLYGFAAVLKPQLAGGAILTPWLIGLARSRNGRVTPLGPRQVFRAGLAPMGIVVLGTSLPIAVVVIYFLSHGALAWMTDTLFGFVPQYSKLGHVAHSLPVLLGQSLLESVLAFSRHNVIGLVILAALPYLLPLEREGIAHVAAVLFFPIVGIGIQAKFFPYHYGTVLPFVSLLAAWGWWKIWTRARYFLVPALLTVVAAYWLKDSRVIPPYDASLWDRNSLRFRLVFGPNDDPLALLDHLHTAADVNAGDNRRASAWIAAHTRVDSSMFVWGFEPVIYDLAARAPATRYIYNVPERVPWGVKHRRILMNDIRQRVPEIVIVEHNDIFPFVTGDYFDSARALTTFPELSRFLSTHYEPGPKFGKLDLLVKRPEGRLSLPASANVQMPISNTGEQ